MFFSHQFLSGDVYTSRIKALVDEAHYVKKW